MSNLEKPLERVRHELKFRICEVVSVNYLTPKMIRVEVTSPDLSGFTSLSYDDHVKLFFVPDGGEIALPISGPNGLQFPEGMPRPEGRDYTPRHFDSETNTLTLDFVTHGDGPAITWAKNAKPGDTVGLGGPRGSFVLSEGFDWYMLIGDETALPAIGRRIEELSQGQKAIALIEIADDKERQTFDVKADVNVQWLARNGAKAGNPELVLSTIREQKLPDGNVYIFIAGEAEMVKAARDFFVGECGHNPDWIKAASYWRKGEADFYDGHEH